MDAIQNFITNLHIPVLLIIGVATFIALFFGKSMRFIRLPSIIGFMILGVITGPSLLNLINDELRDSLSFLTEIALGFVAVSIGLELSFNELKKQGKGIIVIIFSESFLAFILVAAGLFILTQNIVLALLFGAIAPASAPAGTVAVIKEYKAKGSLTKALYAVVGFDDGLGIIIFGFISAITRSIISSGTGQGMTGLIFLILAPFGEIIFGILLGIALSILFVFIARKLKNPADIFTLLFAFILIDIGICKIFHFSLILSNMVIGMVIVNTQGRNLLRIIHLKLEDIMPLLFLLFFTLAGAQLHLGAIPSIGILGVVYILARAGGLMGGAWLGALVSNAERKIKNYLGMGILSQAGVAIGLAIIVKHDFSPINDKGAEIGTIVLTTVTATCIIFEIIGPILTRIALKKAGEIEESKKRA
ncbi:MAG: cation:proton antiporter [Spirochaetales bacterium]|nr:cation:proton antiporter [Spirochaetales bacterium]